MALPTSYMTGGYSKVPKYFETISNAQAPDKFTVKFMKDLGFTSSNDTQFINILKSIGFLDDSGTPTERYFAFFDKTNAKRVVAEGIKEAYADIFMLNVKAYELGKDELKGKFKQLGDNKVSDATLTQKVSTFVALCEYADWSEAIIQKTDKTNPEDKEDKDGLANGEISAKAKTGVSLCYDIHIHLPATRDEKVYDALFSSLTKHINLE